MENVIQQIKLSAIHPSGMNPRKTFDDASINELAESIKSVGVLSPIIVRKHKIKGLFEIVCGDRRFRASQVAKVSTLPCIVMELTDEQAFELMITENLQRKDIHPLEEASAFSSLIEKGTYDIASLCQRFGKSETYIRHRIKLNDLTEPFKELLDKETINLSMAFEICKLDTKYQKEYFNDTFKKGQEWNIPKTIKDVKIYIERNFSNKLTKASFSLSETFNHAGACNACLKNTACNMSLFPDASEEGICLDKDCFDKKSNAHLFKIAKEVQETSPDILILQSEYNYGDKDKKTVSDLMVEGVQVNEFPKMTWIVDAPQGPGREDYEDGEEGNLEFSNDFNEWVKDHQEYSENVASGIYRQALMVTGNRAGTIVYLENKATGAHNIIPEGDNADINIKNQIKELKEKEKRNFEIYFDKTYQEIMKSELFDNKKDNNYFKSGSRLSATELKALLITMLTRIGYSDGLIEELQNKGKYEGSCCIDNNKKLEIVESMTDEQKNKLTRIYLYKELYSTVAWPNHDTNKIIIEVAREFNPNVVNQISLDKQGRYLKQKETIQKKIEELESKLSI